MGINRYHRAGHAQKYLIRENVYSKRYNGITEFTFVSGYKYSLILRANTCGLVPGATYTFIAAVH